MAFKKLFALSALCATFFTAKAESTVLPISITPADIAPYLQLEGQIREAVANGTIVIDGNNCVALQPAQLEGTLMGQIVDYVDDILVGELIEQGELVNGKYQWGHINGCLIADTSAGYGIEVHVSEKNSCKNKCSDVKVNVQITKAYVPVMIAADVSPISCNDW